jgi:PKD repeat protein
MRPFGVALRRALWVSACVAMFGLLAPATAAAAGTILVAPTSGDPGTALTVTGGGWTASANVQVSIGGSPVCSLVADGSGALSGNQTNNGCQVPSGLSAGSQPLTASDPTDGTATGTDFTVTPFASFTALPAPLTYGTTLNLDASGSQGTITHYLWNFGDGTTGSTTMPTTTHTYATVGNYVVTLTVVDSSGNIDSASQTVDVTGSAPTAAFISPAAAVTGTTLAFDGSRSSTSNTGAMITGYVWDWGDGSPDASGATATHTYAAAGTYTVTLTVTDSAGESGSVSHPVVVDDRPPIAVFDPSSGTFLAGSPVQFDGTPSSDPDGTITGYSWNFGDGGTSTAAQPSHKYLSVGTFTVSLTVTDNLGNTGTVSHQITVIAPPPVQTLVLTPLAAPAVVKSGPASTTRSGLVNLGEREFCPGPGSRCTVTLVATSKGLSRSAKPLGVGRSVITIGSNGSTELTFRLSSRARTFLLKHGHLPVRVTITARRSKLTATKTMNLTLVPSRR